MAGIRDLAYDPAPKEVALAQDYLTTYGLERSVFVMRHAVEAAKAVDFPIQTFGDTKNFLPQALAAWENHAGAEEAEREEEARADEQRRREREEQERRRWLAEIRETLPEKQLEALRHRAEEALATDGVARTHLGYAMLVKLKLDELLLETSYEGGHPASEAATPDATLTSPASNGQGALNRRTGKVPHTGPEATRHG